MKIYARQGDIAIFAVEDAPDHGKALPRHRGRLVLAEGEATGHAHAIADRTATLYEIDDTTDRFLSIMNASATLVHEEHGAITLEPGNYVVRRQVEYQPRELPRQVAD
jgi:hypothetical protein